MGCIAFAEAYPNAPSCCGSCHEDEAYGYDFFDYEVKGQTYFLCCALANWAEEANLLA